MKWSAIGRAHMQFRQGDEKRVSPASNRRRLFRLPASAANLQDSSLCKCRYLATVAPFLGGDTLA